jgi:S1-C subfamily serine protease
MGTLVELSNDLAGAVARAGTSVVAVNARQRLSSTGVHWRAGLVVTADHTVRMEDDLTVTLPDGRAVAATLAGRDPSTDIAVLRVDPAAVPAAHTGSAASLSAGHIVLALGYGPRVSWGVVSAAGDAWHTWRGGRIDRLLRLDLTLYPGFSGGPLVDMAGDTLGIVTSGLSRHASLAIPSETVDRVLTELASKGRIARAYLGVGMQPVRLPDTLRSALKLDNETGVMILSVQAGSPAASAGVVMGDVLWALDGRPVQDTADVQAMLGPDRVGTTVRASVLRGGQPLELTITVGERPPRGR